MKIVSTMLLVAAACMTTACGTANYGKQFDDAYVSKIIRGETTKDEVRRNLGEPLSVANSSSGEAWTYQHADYGSYASNFGSTFGIGQPKRTNRMLMIYFVGERVKEFSYSVQR